MADGNVIVYPPPAPGRRERVGIPNAAISVARHADGRWMWGLSFTLSIGGEGFHPLPKWERFAETEQLAVNAGAQELLERLTQRSWREHPQADVLRKWAESITAPAQGGLFA